MDLQIVGNLCGILDVIWFFENITFKQIERLDTINCVICISDLRLSGFDVSENFVLYCPCNTVHRTFYMMALVIAPCHFVLSINSGNYIKNITGAKLGRAHITPNLNFSNLNSFLRSRSLCRCVLQYLSDLLYLK